jgi:calpain-7
MASISWQRKLEEAQDLTNRGTRSEFDEDYSTAFQCYIRAGELYLWLVKERPGVEERSRFRAAAEKVLSRAETIKQVKKNVRPVERRSLSDEEQARAIDAGSTVDSIELPDWSNQCCQPGPSSLIRSPPELSPKQLEQKARYQKRKDLPIWAKNTLYDTRRPLRGCHIVQRVVTDCSFVAALEVAAEHDARWGTKVSGNVCVSR